MSTQRIAEELLRLKQTIGCLSLSLYYHGFKLLNSLIDGESGVMEHRISQLLARHLLDHLQIQVRVDGLEHAEGLRHYCVISNHASYLDWAVLLGHFPSSLRFIAKKELVAIPVIGSYLRNRGILINRARGQDALTAIGAAVKDGEPWPILLFPEGTRTPDGQLKPFKLGLKILAEAGLTMLPVGIWGTYEAMPRHARAIKTGSRLRMVINPPVDPSNFSDPAALAEELRNRIDGCRTQV